MATASYHAIFWLSELLLLSFSSTSAQIIARFPSSVNRPEKLSASTPNGLYREEVYTQILDHFDFNPQSYQTFQQRYLVNDTFWGGAKVKAPIFVYTGNEGDIEWFAQNTGFLFDTAPYFKALLVFIEHRYYGKSMPFGGQKEVAYPNSSTNGYLSSTQALADYATLIVDLKKNLSAVDSPVVVFGGSYGGMLAAWFRMKYPHIAIGALASSAPILHFMDLVSPYVFNDIVTQDYRGESENCYQVIKGSWDQIDEATETSEGQELLHKSFRTCESNTSGKVASWLYRAWQDTAMTDYPTPSNFLSPLPAYPVKKMCEAIDNPAYGNDTFAKLYAAANIYYNSTGTVPCFNLDDDSDPHGLGGWQWQACTEMIMPMGSNEESIFPAYKWDYESRASNCKSAYGVNPRPYWITTYFGGPGIYKTLKRSSSNIIFFNGLRDPWSGGGVLKNISNSIVAIVAKEGAHHVDLRFKTKEDPEWLTQIRRQEVMIISSWITQYYQDLSL